MFEELIQRFGPFKRNPDEVVFIVSTPGGEDAGPFIKDSFMGIESLELFFKDIVMGQDQDDVRFDCSGLDVIDAQFEEV